MNEHRFSDEHVHHISLFFAETTKKLTLSIKIGKLCSNPYPNGLSGLHNNDFVHIVTYLIFIVQNPLVYKPFQAPVHLVASLFGSMIKWQKPKFKIHQNVNNFPYTPLPSGNLTKKQWIDPLKKVHFSIVFVALPEVIKKP